MRRLIFATFSLVFACTPDDDRGPQTVRVLALASPTTYRLQDERLETLESARQVRGSVAHLRGGGSVFLDESLLAGDLASESQDDVHQGSLVDGDRPVEATYHLDGDVLVPTDWESLLLFSFYHHTERAFSFYRELGVETAAQAPFPSYFNVRFGLLVGFGTPLIRDNAAYAPLADGLLLFPSNVLDEGVPLCVNEGVVAHELSHGFKHRIIHGDEARFVYADWNRVAINSYRADDEGLADYFGAVFTGDPNFIQSSLEGIDIDRDVSVPRVFSSALYDALYDRVASYSPYPLGSALASWLWETANNDAALQRELGSVIIATLYDLRGTLDEDYRITTLIDAIMAHSLPSLRVRGCSLLEDRLLDGFREVPTCGIY